MRNLIRHLCSGLQEKDGGLAWSDIINLELESDGRCFAAEITEDQQHLGGDPWNLKHVEHKTGSDFQPNSFTSRLKCNVLPYLSLLFSHNGRSALFCFLHLVVFVKMVNMRSISYYGMAAKGLSFMLLWLQGLAAHCGFLGGIFAQPANAKPEQVSSLPVCRVSLRSLRGISVSPTRGFHHKLLYL